MRIRVELDVFNRAVLPINNRLEHLELDWIVVAYTQTTDGDPMKVEYLLESVKKEITLNDLLPALKDGMKARRLGWNGKDQWVSYTRGRTLDLEKDDIWTLPIKQVAFKNNGKVKLRPYFNLKTQDDEIQVGWVPSVSDLLATDWELVE